MAEDGKKQVEKEKEAIKWKGEEMLVAEEKWVDIWERISCVGHSSCTTAIGRGEWMVVRRGATEETQERGRGWGVMNSWPIPSRMPSNLCYKEGHPSRRQAAVLYTNAQTLKHTAHMLGSHSQRAQWSQPGATVHHPANSITTWGVESCSTAKFLKCRNVLLFIIISIYQCILCW